MTGGIQLDILSGRTLPVQPEILKGREYRDMAAPLQQAVPYNVNETGL
jgi:hypothetical protein